VAFLDQAFIRSPKVLWGELDEETKKMVISEMRKHLKSSYGLIIVLMFTARIYIFS